jgi:hypothetical protein
MVGEFEVGIERRSGLSATVRRELLHEVCLNSTLTNLYLSE